MTSVRYGRTPWADEEACNPATRSATIDPITTLALIRSGIRLASLVNHTRILPWLRKMPWNGWHDNQHADRFDLTPCASDGLNLFNEYIQFVVLLVVMHIHPQRRSWFWQYRTAHIIEAGNGILR